MALTRSETKHVQIRGSISFANWLSFHIACIDKFVPHVFLLEQ